MEGIEDAIRHAAEAGKLRSYVRRNGETGLGGLLRLADRHSAASAAALTNRPSAWENHARSAAMRTPGLGVVRAQRGEG